MMNNFDKSILHNDESLIERFEALEKTVNVIAIKQCKYSN